MVKKILIGLAGVVLALVVAIATRPATFHVERSIVVAAPAAAIFPLVNDYQARGVWYPWDKLDPAQHKTFSTPSFGAGASYSWIGNKEVGKGKQTMTASVDNTRIEETLEFIEPFPSTAQVTFTFAEKDGSTSVTWSMGGDNTFMGKAMSLVASMDSFIGKDFDNGLAALKSESEKTFAAQQAAAKLAAEQAAAAAAVAVDGAAPTAAPTTPQ